MSQLDELRRIIVGDNSAQLESLRKRIENVEARTRDVSEVLAPAIDAGIKENDNIVESLRKPVSDGLKKTIRQEPEVYAEILYPAIAPSIRRAISQAISSLMVTINQTIESATSISGLGMRVESWQTGVPYAQLVLRKSLIYRVEHVYLIERETGMLLAESAAEGDVRMDSDAVSAMFSAIQSFVQDSFSGNEADRLTDFKVGAHTVWIAHGPKAMLACVILGDAPESLKEKLYDTLDDIRTDFAIEISEFDGDTSTMSDVEQYLDPILQLEMKEPPASEDRYSLGLATRLMYLLLFGLICYWLYNGFDSNRKSATARHYLNQTPGILVTRSYWDADELVVEGLQDTDAEVPWRLLQAHGMDQQTLRFETKAFESRDPRLEAVRLRRALQPEEGTQIRSSDSGILISGSADLVWLLDRYTQIQQLLAANRLLDDGLVVAPASVERFVALYGLQSEPSVMERVRALTSETDWATIDVRDVMWLQSLMR